MTEIDAAELARLRERERNRHELGLISGLSFPELDSLIAALGKARESRDQWQREFGAERRLKETHARDAENARAALAAARALLKECVDDWIPEDCPNIRARIDKELG